MSPTEKVIAFIRISITTNSSPNYLLICVITYLNRNIEHLKKGIQVSLFEFD